MNETSKQSTQDTQSAQGTPGTERRSDHELRKLFEQAYDVIRPFFDDSSTWEKGHGHEALAYRALRDQFPALSQEQAFTIVSAAQRVFASGNGIAPY